MNDKKMIVSDYDGTYKKSLYPLDSEVLENNEAVRNFINGGNVFMFATGRVFSSFYKEYANNNLLSDYISCANGNVIFNQNFDLISCKKIKKSFLETLKKYYSLIDSLESKNAFGDIDINSIVEIEMVYKDLTAKKTLLEYLHKNSIFSYYHDVNNPLIIHIFNNNFDKVDSIYTISQLCKINKNNIYTIGDGYNDLKMINKFNGYAIKSSNPDLVNASLDTVDTVKDLINIVNNDEVKRR